MRRYKVLGDEMYHTPSKEVILNAPRGMIYLEDPDGAEIDVPCRLHEVGEGVLEGRTTDDNTRVTVREIDGEWWLESQFTSAFSASSPVNSATPAKGGPAEVGGVSLLWGKHNFWANAQRQIYPVGIKYNSQPVSRFGVESYVSPVAETER